jgi:hypothetical protein
MKQTRIRRYSELIALPTFEERFEYLKLEGVVGSDTFGAERYLNQAFYNSPEWKDIRDRIIIRDGGCDLAVAGRDIFKRVIIHHMNPVDVQDICNMTAFLTDPEYLVCVSHITHNAIHYGNADILPKTFSERRPNDTCPWKT